MANFNIHIDQDSIDNGALNSRNSCPISLAVLKAKPEVFDVDVGTRQLTMFLSETEELCFRLPEEALQFISDFDAGDPVEPISFRLLSSAD